jgi:CheY-like chemotaxis protein
MGGEVLLESEQNVGSTFSIVFKDVETVKQKAPIRANRNIKILSVDDSELNQKIIQGILKKTNHDLLFASSEDTALEVIQNNTPELFIMDIQLPGTDGIELTRIIKKDKRFIETPFIAATGYTFTGKEETVANELFDDIIYKPLNSRALLSLVEKHIDIKAKISIDSYSNSQTAEETGISFSENDNNDVIYVTDKEFSLFSADINRLALTMELNSIDNLSDRMIRYYNESKPSSEKDKLRVAKINSHLEQLKNSISEFDIEGITNTLNTIKDIFNGYNEN